MKPDHDEEMLELHAELLAFTDDEERIEIAPDAVILGAIHVLQRRLDLFFGEAVHRGLMERAVLEYDALDDEEWRNV